MKTNNCSLEVTGIILAGGKAKRLGEDKRLLKIGSKSILDTTIDIFSDFCQETILVTEQPYKCVHQVRIVSDEVANQGPLRGILSGLKAASTFYSLVVGCDMPFLNQELLKFLVREAEGASLVVPTSPKGLEPLCAVYSKSCIGPISDQLLRGNFKITSFFNKVRLKKVSQAEVSKFDPQFLSFFNINTRNDVDLAEKMLAEGKNVRST